MAAWSSHTVAALAIASSGSSVHSREPVVWVAQGLLGLSGACVFVWPSHRPSSIEIQEHYRPSGSIAVTALRAWYKSPARLPMILLLTGW